MFLIVQVYYLMLTVWIDQCLRPILFDKTFKSCLFSKLEHSYVNLSIHIPSTRSSQYNVQINDKSTLYRLQNNSKVLEQRAIFFKEITLKEPFMGLL